jgi:hypothetical protein
MPWECDGFRLFFAVSQKRDHPTMRTLAEVWDWAAAPLNILVAFPYLADWLAMPAHCRPARTILDSGAFSAWNSGKAVDFPALMRESKSPRWQETVCLDVIGDAAGSVRNWRIMRASGCGVMPVFHYGDPWDHLAEYCRESPRVGLSCRFGEPEPDSMRWLGECFRRQWPHRFHSFGWAKGAMLKAFPFETADTASVNYNTVAMGNWKAYGNSPLRVRGKVWNLSAEISWYRDLERDVRSRWAKELARLAPQGGTDGKP